MKRKVKLLTVLLTAALLLTALLPAAAAESLPAGRYLIDIPSDKKLTVRESPSAGSQAIDYLLKDETVEIVETVNGWAKGRQNGHFGWFDARYAELQQEYDCAMLIADISSAGASAVDFSLLKASGVGGVILRFGVSANGAQVVAADANFDRLYQGARDAGLAIGVYFASAAVNADGMEKEAQWTAAQLESQAPVLSLPVFYRPTTAAQKALSSAENTLLISSFCHTIEAAGYDAGIYLPADWTSANMDFSALSAYARWIADEGDYCNFTHSFDLWQYSDQETVDGVTGAAGMSYLFTDLIDESEPVEPTETTPVEPEESTTEALPELPAHREGEFVTVREPGCSDWGEERAYCVDCGALLHIRLLPPVGHRDSMWETAKEPTETEGGMLIRRCDVCGEISKVQYTLPLNSEHTHVMSDWTYIDAVNDSLLRPLDAEEGMTGEIADFVEVFACTVAREKVMRCADCGEIVAVYADTPAAHTPEDNSVVTAADCENDGHSRLFCRDCGDLMEDIITPAYGHLVEEWEILREATTDQEGERQGVCLRCGKTVTEIIPKLEGVLGDVDGDQQITTSDARLILRFAVHLEEPANETVRRLADIDGDESITTADARKTLRIAVGLDHA